MTITKLYNDIQSLNQIDKINEIIDELNGGVSITVDTELNESSPNPVQNAVITAALGDKQDVLTAGSGISISDEGVISSTSSEVVWGNISGDLSEQTDLTTALNEIQNSIPLVTDIYDSSSTDAMSGVAVASAINSHLGKIFKPSGSIAFENLPSLTESNVGNVYNITNAFETTADFVEGAGKSFPIGTNVAIVNIGTTQSPSYKYDVFAGEIDLSNYQTLLTAGNGIDINNGVISADGNYSYVAECPALETINGTVTWNITHNLNTRNLICNLYYGNVEIGKDVTITSNNTITVSFKNANNVSAGDYKIVILANGGDILVQSRNCNVSFHGNVTNTNGIISNFSNTSYCELPIIFNPSSNWEMMLKFTVTGETVTNARVLGAYNSGECGIVIGISNLKTSYWLYSNTGTSDICDGIFSDTDIIINNVPIWLKIIFTGTQYQFYHSYDGLNFNLHATVEDTTLIHSLGPSLLGISIPSDILPRYLSGSIDLNECYIKSAENIIWQGTTISNTLKIQEVKKLENIYSNIIPFGNLIDNEGIISGFSNNIHAEIPFEFNVDTVWEKFIKIHTAEIGIGQDIMGSNVNFKGATLFLNTDGELEVYISSNDTTWDIADGTQSTLTLSANTDYYIKYYFTGSAYKVDISTNGTFGGEEINYITVNNSNNVSAHYVRLGSHIGGLYPFLGSIDLNESYIKVNNITVWQGRINETLPPAISSLRNITDDAHSLMAYNAMPSDVSIDLELGADGTTFLAPSTGYIVFRAHSTTYSNATFQLYNRTSFMTSVGRAIEQNIYYSYEILACVPCVKGDLIQYYHSNNFQSGNDDNWSIFKFVYANGTAHEYTPSTS